METLTGSTVFQIYIAAVIVLGINLLVLANNTALSRAKHDEAVNPEDKKLNAKANIVFYEGNDKTQRYRRAHANALENIPLFLITGFLLTLTPVSVTAAAILFGVFVLFRIIHSLAYMKQLQPWRTLSFGVALVDQFAILCFLGYGVFIG